MVEWESRIRTGVEHIKTCDLVLAEVILQYKLIPDIQPHANYYQELVKSIVGQQISLQAAASILKRLIDFYGNFPSPEEIVNTDYDSLRAVGLSNAKTRYIQDFAHHVVSGKLNFGRFDIQSNQEILVQLTEIKGIGDWTVQMFLIFAMGRLDVLPYGDLAIKKGIMQLYGMRQIPTKEEIENISTINGWSPYQTIASWYIWKSLETTK